MKSIFCKLFISLVAVAILAGCASVQPTSTDTALQQQKSKDQWKDRSTY